MSVRALYRSEESMKCFSVESPVGRDSCDSGIYYIHAYLLCRRRVPSSQCTMFSDIFMHRFFRMNVQSVSCLNVNEAHPTSFLLDTAAGK